MELPRESCGCGSTSLAVLRTDPKSRVVAADIDEFAIKALELNAEKNLSKAEIERLEVSSADCFKMNEDFDTILFGDMFYDDDFCVAVENWLQSRAKTSKPFRVLIGDPGRQFWIENSLIKKCTPIREIPLHSSQVCQFRVSLRFKKLQNSL